MEEMEGIDIHF